MTPLPATDNSAAGSASASLPATQPTTAMAPAPIRSLQSFDALGSLNAFSPPQRESQQAAALHQLGRWQDFGGNDQGISQPAYILQQLGIWQQMEGRDQGISPMPALSSAAMLPHVRTDLTTFPAGSRSSNATDDRPQPQPLPSTVQAADSNSIQRMSLGIPHSASSFAAVQREFLSGDMESISMAGNQEWNPTERSQAAALSSQFASLPTAQSLAESQTSPASEVIQGQLIIRHSTQSIA